MRYHDPSLENYCQQCDKPLFGRTDKRFCNDACRNTYNRKKRQEAYLNDPPFIRQITHILRENREILYPLTRFQPPPTTLSRHRLIEANFHFKFFTSIRKQKDGFHYCFCYEYGWKETADNRVVIVINEEQAEI